ncbi:DNA/RNA non-specific endonuclease, partial [Pseudomonas aeruginosa]|nr:DNA/RNA non-specific endonuclease [Pseudomonas aeruginosa]
PVPAPGGGGGGVVGYPARDSRNDAGAMEDIFGNIYDVKRFAPGEVVGLPHDAWYLTHDCSTLGGNSGSAVLSIDGGEVVGLHFGGQFRKTNYAVKASVIRSLLVRRAWVPVAGAELKRGVPRFQEKQRSVADLAERKGFDEAFLGPKAALPKPGKSHQVLPVGKGTRLDYLHFSVVMSASRRLPILTAVNIDGALKRSLKRKDSWGFDPRIEAAAQVGHKDFYGPASFDKGHMVRREDPGWGDSDAIARQAEDDTFVYTNAVPQVAQLNQRSWLSLEDYVLQNARSEGFRISVFTGPVFRDDDPLYQGVQVPLEFWKVVAMIDADSGELGVSAYLLGQEGMMPSEGFRYGAFKTYQVPLAKVEASADLRFSSALRKADVLAGTPLEEALESGRFIEIDGPDDLLLSRPGPAGKGR